MALKITEHVRISYLAECQMFELKHDACHEGRASCGQRALLDAGAQL
jgi:hypothetical protein